MVRIRACHISFLSSFFINMLETRLRWEWQTLCSSVLSYFPLCYKTRPPPSLNYTYRAYSSPSNPTTPRDNPPPASPSSTS